MTYYSTKDLARMYRVSAKTVRHWLRAGRIEHVRLPGGYRVTKVALDAFEASNTTKSPNH